MFRHKKYKGIAPEQVEKVLKSEKVHKAVDNKATVVQEYWKSVSPVFSPANPAEHRKAPKYGEPGQYRDSVTVSDISDDAGTRERVQPTDFKKHWVEFGVYGHHPYGPMAKVKAKFRREMK